MSVSLSIKDVPDDLADLLRDRASGNHRSLQGELMHILETALRPKPFQARALWQHAQALKLSTPAESVRMIRRERRRR